MWGKRGRAADGGKKDQTKDEYMTSLTSERNVKMAQLQMGAANDQVLQGVFGQVQGLQNEIQQNPIDVITRALSADNVSLRTLKDIQNHCTNNNNGGDKVAKLTKTFAAESFRALTDKKAVLAAANDAILWTGELMFDSQYMNEATKRDWEGFMKELQTIIDEKTREEEHVRMRVAAKAKAAAGGAGPVPADETGDANMAANA